jgi:hypothetical protein
VDGRPVGFIYREAPDATHDSGWPFLSGSESQEYLEAPIGSMYGKDANGSFTLEDMPSGQDA